MSSSMFNATTLTSRVRPESATGRCIFVVEGPVGGPTIHLRHRQRVLPAKGCRPPIACEVQMRKKVVRCRLGTLRLTTNSCAWR
jgi:hypothetical protein